jgi:hypothetical protein
MCVRSSAETLTRDTSTPAASASVDRNCAALTKSEVLKETMYRIGYCVDVPTPVPQIRPTSVA